MAEGLELKLEIAGLNKLTKKLEKLQSKLELTDEETREELGEHLRDVMFKDLSKRFASSPSTVVGGLVYGGQYWDHLSDYYLSIRPDRVGGQIYVDTGDLKNSLTSLTSNTINNITKGTATYEFGTRLPYAESLQEMRPIVFLHQKLLEELVEAYEKYLIKEFEDEKT